MITESERLEIEKSCRESGCEPPSNASHGLEALMDRLRDFHGIIPVGDALTYRREADTSSFAIEVEATRTPVTKVSDTLPENELRKILRTWNEAHRQLQQSHTVSEPLPTT